MTLPRRTEGQAAPAAPAQAVRSGLEPAVQTAQPRPVTDPQLAAVLAMLKVEQTIREAKTEAELLHIMVNEPRNMLRARQIFVVTLDRDSNLPRLAAISGIPVVDRSSPLVQSLQRTLVSFARDAGLDAIKDFRLSAYSTEDDPICRTYPLQDVLWVPIGKPQSPRRGGMLLAREIPWTQSDTAIATHLASALSYAWTALTQSRPLLARFHVKRRTIAGFAILGLVLGTVPVPMTALAPVEVTARQPYIITPSLDGVIDQVLVEPNSRVVRDQLLAVLSQTELKGRLEIAEREVAVARARLQQANQMAFSDPLGRQTLGVAAADLELKIAERDYARDQLSRTELRAPRAGIANYNDRRDLLGRPVAAGDRLMEIVDPRLVQFTVKVPVADAIVVKPNARVKVFLDSDPLRPIEAKVRRADYRATVSDGVQLGYRVTAEIVDTTVPLPRLGVRGTAQVYGEDVTLWFYLFRRPISTLRQWIGL